MPPGTGDVHITMTQTVPMTGAIIVTTPQQVAVADARKAVAMYRLDSMKVPIIGLIENMAYFTPAELPENKYYLFGKDGGKKLAEEYEIPFLGEVPLIQNIMQGAEDGVPAVNTTDQHIIDVYRTIAENAARFIAISNEKKQIEATTES
jgi:ATP-binding protein involved in chromosome partitioning